MSSISFDNAYLLLLAIPLVILLVVPFVSAVRKENANGHNIASGVIHVLLAVIIAFSAAGTSLETTVTETDVYVLADVSYSSEKNLDTIDAYIKELSGNLPRNSKLGVVCFAKNQQLYVSLGKNLKSVKGADFDYLEDSETDIESALDFAGSLFRENVIKRIVVITDGKQTHVSDSNALKRAVDTLRADGIYVDAVYLDNNIAADAKEVQIVSATATQNTYLERNESAEVTLRSTYATKANVLLLRNGATVTSRFVDLSVGYNTVDFSLNTDESGTFDYEVKVEADGDENQRNNRYTFTQRVSSAVNVMLVTEDASDRLEIESLYREKATVSVFDPKTELPCSIEALCQYDEIIISNADLTKSNDYNLFLSNLDTAVSLFGKSLITYGNVYAHEKEALKPLENMLPVRFGNADRESKLYTLVIDASRSMETLSKFTIAKSAAKQLVNKLNEGDNLCIVAFNGNYHTVYSPDEISDTPAPSESLSTREKALNAIDKINAEHGTVISFGLEQALKLIKGLPYSQKQIMLISDGLTVENEGSTGGEDDRIVAALENMKKNRISVSVIDVGRGADSSYVAENAEKCLKNIASLTSGKYCFASTMEELKDVMFGEGLLDDISDIVIDEPAYVRVLRSSDDVLDGVDFVSGDYVNGFFYNKAKSGSTTVLQANYEGTFEVPLYSYWNYGNGRVSTLACALDKTEDWYTSVREAFLKNVFSTNVPKERVDYPFVVEMMDGDGYLSLNLSPAKIDTSVIVRVTVTAPNGDETTENMTFVSTGYTDRFITHDVGKYDIDIDYIWESGKTYSSHFTYNVSYLSEYDSFAVFDISVLYKMIGSDGTVMKGDDNLKIVNDDDLIGTYVLDLTMPLLIACVVLFAADVAIRKLKWEDIRSLFGKRKK